MAILDKKNSNLIELLRTTIGSVYDKTLNEQNTVIICGAGISIPSGLPSGWELTTSVLRDFCLVGDNSVIDIVDYFKKYNKNVVYPVIGKYVPLFELPRLEVMFSAIKEVLHDKEYENYIQYQLFKSILKHGKKYIYPNIIHYAIADFINNGGVCLSANFDNLIELAYSNKYDKKLPVVSFPLIEHNYNLSASLIKYHGTIDKISEIGLDIDSLSIDGFGLFESEFLNKKTENCENIIFIGFSLSDTIDLVPFLNTLGQKYNVIYIKYSEDRSLSYEKINPNIYKGKEKVETYEYILSHRMRDKLNSFYLVHDFKNDIFNVEHDIIVNQYFEISNDKLLAESYFNIISNEEKIHNGRIQILKKIGLINLLVRTSTIDTINAKLYSNYYYNNYNGYYKECLNLKLDEYWRQSENYTNILDLCGALQEFIFIQQGHIINRLLKIPFFVYVYLKLLIIFSKNRTLEDLRIHRQLSMPILRIFQLISNYRILYTLLPVVCINMFRKYLNFQIEIAKKNKDLLNFRYCSKEVLYLNGLYKEKLCANHDKVYDLFMELFCLNLDTNYFLEVNNLLRFGYIYINPDNLFLPTFESLTLTQDYLNLYKVLSVRVKDKVVF